MLPLTSLLFLLKINDRWRGESKLIKDIACALIPGHANQMVGPAVEEHRAAEFESRTPGV